MIEAMFVCPECSYRVAVHSEEHGTMARCEECGREMELARETFLQYCYYYNTTMNIFVLDKNPKLAAQYLILPHIDKMLIESCQILASALWRHNGITNKADYNDKLSMLRQKYSSFPRQHDDGSVNLYGLGYINHTCVQWCAQSQANVDWLISHALEIARINESHYGRPHACTKRAKWFADKFDDVDFQHQQLTPFAQAMPDQYQVDGNAVLAYRQYYINEKTDYPTWAFSREKWFGVETRG